MSAPEGGATPSRGPAIALAVATATLFALCVLLFPFTADDAYISLRYGKHLAAGHGLTWNPGDVEEVEGYSNFLWTVAMGAAEALAPERSVELMKMLGLACALACLPVVAALARSFGAGPAGVSTATLVLGLSPTFAFWGVSGLETPAYTLALLVGVLWAYRRRPTYPAALAAAALLRPEGAVMFVLVWAWRVALDGRSGGWRAAIVPAARDGALFTALHLPYLLWRRLHYGMWTPNTVHAKFEWFAGLETYVWDLVQYFPAFLAATAWAVAAPGLERSKRVARLPLLLLPAAAALAVMHCRPSVGFYFRFFWPVIPLTFVASGLVVDGVRSLRGRRVAGIVVALVLVHSLLGTDEVVRTARTQRDILERAHRPLAEWIRDNAPPDAEVAMTDCGLVPYVSEATVVDMWGLNDRRTASEGFSVERLLERAPELVVLVSTDPERFAPNFSYEERLFLDAGFRAAYRPERAFSASPHRYNLFVFRKLRAAGPASAGATRADRSHLPASLDRPRDAP